MARNNAGASVAGSLKADSEQDAVNKLRQMQLTPVKISLGVARAAKAVSEPAAKPVPVVAVKVSDLMIFCVNLSSMMGAGIPLSGSLMVISQQLTNRYFGQIIGKVRQELLEGAAFSEALEKFPRVFSKFFVNMVRVGEMSGTMDNVLKTLAAHLERQEELRQKVKGALIYPMILVVAGAAVIILIITFVLPQFVQIFEKAGIELPVMTKLLYNFSLWIRQYWLFLIGGIFALVMGIKQLLQHKAGQALVERLTLKLPLFGTLTCYILVARFCRILSAMLNAGVPLLQGLVILRETIDNAVFAGIVQDVYKSAEKGEGVNNALAKHAEFPPDVVYMISVGETSGNMGAMLNKAADFYENKVEFLIKGLLVYIEPAFICILGACVGCILASVLLPMFDMVKTIQR